MATRKYALGDVLSAYTCLPGFATSPRRGQEVISFMVSEWGSGAITSPTARGKLTEFALAEQFPWLKEVVVPDYAALVERKGWSDDKVAADMRAIVGKLASTYGRTLDVRTIARS